MTAIVHNMGSSFLIAHSHSRLLRDHTSWHGEYSLAGLGLGLLDGHPLLYTFTPFRLLAAAVSTFPDIRTTGFFPACFRKCLINTRTDNGWLFDYERILDGFDPADAACDLARLVFRFLRINETAQFNDAFAGFDADLE